MGNPFDQKQKSPKVVFHYTDMEALINIIRNDSIVFRATNCMYLNDTREITEGITSVERVLKERLDVRLFSNTYIASFSLAEDSLSMWNMYAANGNGCAIGLDGHFLLKTFGNEIRCTYGEKEIDENLSSFMTLSKTGAVSYMGPNQQEMQAQINQVSGIIRQYVSSNIIKTTCIGAKNESFAHEQEIRYIVETNNPNRIKFKTTNGIIIPYVEQKIPKEALRSITIGPINNTELVRKSIEIFLTINGYDIKKIRVKSSNIPYRG